MQWNFENIVITIRYLQMNQILFYKELIYH